MKIAIQDHELVNYNIINHGLEEEIMFNGNKIGTNW